MRFKTLLCLGLITLLVLLSTAAYAQTFSVIYTFTSEETHPGLPDILYQWKS